MSAQPASLEIRVEGPVCAPWVGVRALIEAARPVVGDAAIEAGIALARGPLSLVLELGPLTPDDELARAEAALAEHGMLSHNYRTRTPMARAWNLALEAILPAGAPVRVALSGLDPESMRVLRRLDVVGRLQLTLVADADFPSSGWDLWRREQVQTDTAALGWLAGPGQGRLEQGALSTPAFVAPELALLDEAACPVRSRHVLDGMARAFAAQGFAFCLKLGLALLDGGAPSLTRRQRARAHRLVALSAYNRQVGREGGGPELALLLRHHFTEALRLEPDGAVRAHLCYRMAINAGRRQGEVEAALRFVRRGLRLASGASDRWYGAFLTAWLLNAASYLEFVRQDLPTARAVIEEGLAVLDVDGAPVGWRLEAVQSRSVLLDNAITLALQDDDLETAGALLDRLEGFSRLDPDAGSLKVLRASLLRRMWRLREAAELFDHIDPRGVEIIDAVDQESLASERASIAAQRGRVDEALGHLSLLLTLRERLATPADIAAAELALAIAELRAGLGSARLERCLDGPLAEDPVGEAEIAGWLARAAADRGDAASADLYANRAIGAAVRSGNRATLARIARLAGDCCAALGRRDPAIDAFRRALALAGDSPDLAPERAGALLGLWEQGDAAALEPAADSLLMALRDPEAWWELPRLAGAVEHLPTALRAPLARALAARAT